MKYKTTGELSHEIKSATDIEGVAIPSLPVVNVTGAVALVFAFPEVSPVTKAALLEVRFVTVPPEAELLK